MANKEKNDEFPQQPRDFGFYRQLIEQFRLAWALLLDNRVPIYMKLIPIAALAYAISPLDFIPDVIPVLGILDDVGLIMLALTSFNNMVPRDVLVEHMKDLRMKPNTQQSKTNSTDTTDEDDGFTIDVNAKQSKATRSKR